MNIQSNAIVGNQTTIHKIEEVTYSDYQIKYLSFNEKGVCLNRNNALMSAQANVQIFNLYEKTSRCIIKNKNKVNFMNYMRFGAARIAFRTESVRKNAICFN